jgi:bacillithiol system protein YtxJ
MAGLASWKILSKVGQVEEIASKSSQVSLIFKHSTRCSISTLAMNRLGKQESALTAHFECYYLDLIAFRTVSDLVAERFSVHHESPQVLLIFKGECFYEASHIEIQPQQILDLVAELE